MFDVVLTESAREAFEAADAALQKKLDRCFGQLMNEPRRHNNIKALKGQFSGYLRYRVGDHRVVYRIDDSAERVIVVDIANRRDVYE
ncbi:MAG TPA: type II toxin-antitoxin system RelE/ParE family toxin [Phycisphaerae bacterium]|nr:type II toxin-antitoxin system RelE/ParE family toxin [Phycisphaerae bacterium]